MIHSSVLFYIKKQSSGNNFITHQLYVLFNIEKLLFKILEIPVKIIFCDFGHFCVNKYKK